jgi:hypothetical protein
MPKAEYATGQMIHNLKHWLHFQPIEVVSETRDAEIWIGARCKECGLVTGWHRSIFDARIEKAREL